MRTLHSIRVLSAVYPTKDDPTKGLPIWATLRHFPSDLDFVAYASLPWRPSWIRRLAPPRTYLRYPEPVDPTAAPFRAEPLLYFSVPGFGSRWNGRWLSSALESRIRAKPPQVLLAYRIYPDGYAAVRAAQRLNIPAVICSRGSDLKKIPASGPIRDQTIYAVRHAQAVLGVSQDLVDTSVSLGTPPDRAFLLKNGIDRTVFRPLDPAAARGALGVPADAELVLFVGNLLPVKCLPDLLSAAAELAHKRPLLRIAVIGEGNLAPALRAQAETLGIAARVGFLGAQSAAGIAQWLAASNVLCLPSSSEGMPNVVLEAFSCGRPVAGSSVGGIPELIDPDCGVLFPPENPPALAAALDQVLSRKWDADRIAAKPVDSWQQVAQRTLDICAATLSS